MNSIVSFLNGGGLGAVILIVALIVLAFNAFFVVKQQNAVIIERLGRFSAILGAGLHAKVPFIDRKAATLDPKADHTIHPVAMYGM